MANYDTIDHLCGLIYNIAMTTQIISNAFVSEALDCARRGGLDVGALLRTAQIDAPGGGTVSSTEFGKLWLAIAAGMNDEFFGNAARPMRPGSFALLGHAVRHAPTLDAALRRALRFLQVAIDEPYGTLSVRQGRAVITLHDSSNTRSAFAYRTYWVILHGLTCWLARTRIPLFELEFACPAPRYSFDYHDFFGAPVMFETKQGSLSFDAKYLSIPVQRSEAALKRFLRAAPGSFLTGYQQDEGAQGLVLGVLKTCDPLEWPGFETLAADLNRSPSVLRRQLRSQGQSYRALKADQRRRLATALLTETDDPIAEIAAKLGYAEPSAFYRAFHSWTGKPPGALR